MKKILFASTALIATAGVAAAEVSFGGYGRFGLGYQEDRGGVGSAIDDTVIVSRFRLNIDGKAETDGGVAFSARVRLQADETAANGEAGVAALNGARFSVEYGGLRVDVGNIAGAIDNLPNYFGNEPGLESFTGQYAGNDYSFVGYTTGGAGANGVYVRYAVGDFAVAASYDSAPSGAPGDRMAVHAAYTFGNITAALGYAETDTVVSQDMTVLTVAGDFGPLNATLMIGDETVAAAAASDMFYGVSAAYDISSAATVNFAYGGGSGDADQENIALGMIYDLGGGVSLRGGIASITPNSAADSYMKADFGAKFDF